MREIYDYLLALNYFPYLLQYQTTIASTLLWAKLKILSF